MATGLDSFSVAFCLQLAMWLSPWSTAPSHKNGQSSGLTKVVNLWRSFHISFKQPKYRTSIQANTILTTLCVHCFVNMFCFNHILFCTESNYKDFLFKNDCLFSEMITYFDIKPINARHVCNQSKHKDDEHGFVQ